MGVRIQGSAKVMDYSQLIEELTQSFTSQIEMYKQLQVIVQKMLGKIALSRGVSSGVMELFEEKQKLLEKIEKERDSSKKRVEVWQKEKGNIPRSDLKDRFVSILTEAEKVIEDFLETENQLKKYLEHTICSKGNTTNT